MAAEKVSEALAIEEQQAEKRKNITVIAAKAQGESLIEIAKGKSEAEKLEGKGYADKLKQIIEAGINPRQLPQMFINEKKWDAIGKCKSEDKVIIVEGGHGGASYGAELGTGFEASKRRDRNLRPEVAGSDSKPTKPEVKIVKSEKK
jgi:regulator of protease activity HflC (stomatin/prohibitin superfamily)